MQMWSAALLLPAVAFAGTPCEKLTSMTIPGVEVRSAAVVPEGPAHFPGLAPNATLPAFCRVELVAHPVPDSEIGFEVWMPEEGWNGKFQGVGNGGYSGALNYRAMAEALRLGYAAASCDTGHTGDDMSFAVGHPEKLVDFAHRAMHVMTENAKLLVRVHMGRYADHSYFVGCSTGGQQALAEAQKYPGDYDGIVAGAPAYNRLGQTFAFLWGWMAMHRDDGSLVVPVEKLPLITKAVVEACDGADGLEDGLIDDPRRCRVDLSGILTPEQQAAVHKVWDGLKNPRTGQQIFAGWPMGSEDFGDQSWRTYLTNPREPMRVQVFRYFLFHDPSWDYRTIDWDRDFAYTIRQLGFMNATDPDLSPFASRGGKLLMYAGWSDPVVPPADTIAYYEAVIQAMGGQEKTLAFARLFLAPGMGHCMGGPGPNQFDAVTALDQWVTGGKAPDSLLAKHATKGVVDRTRPLCPYPQRARYQGSGSIDDAGSFACAAAVP